MTIASSSSDRSPDAYAHSSIDRLNASVARRGNSAASRSWNASCTSVSSSRIASISARRCGAGKAAKSDARPAPTAEQIPVMRAIGGWSIAASMDVLKRSAGSPVPIALSAAAIRSRRPAGPYSDSTSCASSSASVRVSPGGNVSAQRRNRVAVRALGEVWISARHFSAVASSSASEIAFRRTVRARSVSSPCGIVRAAS